MMFNPTAFAAWFLVVCVSITLETQAASAPDLPLPPCTYVGGQFYGACPAESDFVAAVSAGRFSVGGSVVVSTRPVMESCDGWNAYSLQMNVSPCYSRVSAPRVLGCATIDLQDNKRFRELSCNEALYLDTRDVPSPLFTQRRPGGATDPYEGTRCGATPNYPVYGSGGPATQIDRIWRTRGPLALDCEVTFAGPRRPDGLYGPTWVKIRVQIAHLESGEAMPGDSAWADVYVPINGDLRQGGIATNIETDLPAGDRVARGSSFDATVTLTADDTLSGPVTDIDWTPLEIAPSDLIEIVSDSAGSEPPPTSLAAGATVTRSYVLRGLADGNVTLRSQATGVAPGGKSLEANSVRQLEIVPAELEITASGEVHDVDWDSGRVFATYRATLTNISTFDAENVQLGIQLPKSLAALSLTIGNDSCKMPGFAVGEQPPSGGPLIAGGTIACDWSTLTGGDSVEIEFKTRILSATDLDSLQSGLIQGARFSGVEFEAKADVPFQRRVSEVTKVELPFRGGSYDSTRQLMLALAPHFDYETDNLAEGCNVYKLEIFDRLKAIHSEYPEVFTDLSYGPVTSQDYQVLGIPSAAFKAGHVGVVVYRKGTNYLETGIIINGTPIVSPLNASSQIGPDDLPPGTGAGGWTAMNGLYLRTDAADFPGLPTMESQGYEGFEGQYVDNGNEFTYGGSVAPPPPDPEPLVSCPFAPDAVVVTTASPVEVIVTNTEGQQVETANGFVVTQELDGGVHSMAFPHEDGTYGWVLVLPVDDYEVELHGSGTGPYRLTLTTFGDDGAPIDEVFEGDTTEGAVSTYSIDGIKAAPEPEPPVAPPPRRRSSGGSGAFDLLTLLGLTMLLAWRYVGQRRRR